ncbi:MAG: lipopolysaccharide biosynthesis protein [Anaerostipes sp.]|uniref:lipopolysaccharide biosynthesis protein n=1 Tax=Anaerostipes sp. TaxID=1872530 RepID=UPI00399651EB
MNKNKELAKNTAIISVGKFCTQFLSFLLLPFYTSILSTTEYGTVDLLITYQQLIGYIVFFQIEQAIFRFLVEVRNKKEDASKIITSCMGFAVGQSVILGIIMCMINTFINIQYWNYLFAYVVAVIMSGCMLQIARGFGKNFVYALGSFISAIVTIVLNILFLAVFKMRVTGMLLAYILGSSVCALTVFFILKVYKYISTVSFNRKTLRMCLLYSLPLVPNVLSWWVMSASDRTIVAFFLGTAYNGVLTVANKFPGAYSAFYTVFNLSWTESAVIHINDDDAEQFFKSVIERVYRLFSAVAVGLLACLPFVFNFLVNVNYHEAYYQVPIYMLASLCQVFQGMYSVIYIALKKTKEVAKSTVISAIINFLVCILLINSIGLYASSISTLISYLFLCIWRYNDLKKYLYVRFNMKLLGSTIVAFVVVCFGYYSHSFIMKVIILIFVVIYSCYINRDVVLIIIKSPKNIKKTITGK